MRMQHDHLPDRIALGDETAMREFSIRYNWPLYGFIRRLGVHDADARELTCTCITEILLKVKTHYKPGTNFEAWVFAVAKNAARGWLRKEKRTELVALPVDAGDTETPPAAPATDRLELRAAVMALDPLDREILRLRYGGHETPTFAQIAAELSNHHGKEFKEATIRQRHGRALTQLKHLLVTTTTIGKT